jgi:hypothetical protein
MIVVGIGNDSNIIVISSFLCSTSHLFSLVLFRKISKKIEISHFEPKTERQNRRLQELINRLNKYAQSLGSTVNMCKTIESTRNLKRTKSVSQECSKAKEIKRKNKEQKNKLKQERCEKIYSQEVQTVAQSSLVFDKDYTKYSESEKKQEYDKLKQKLDKIEELLQKFDNEHESQCFELSIRRLYYNIELLRLLKSQV